MSQSDELTGPQRTFLTAVAAGQTFTEAAQAAGVDRRTALRWRSQEAVRTALDELDAEQMAAARSLVADRLQEAVTVLAGLMADPATPPQVRRQAAVNILEAAGFPGTTPVAQMPIVIRWPEGH